MLIYFLYIFGIYILAIQSRSQLVRWVIVLTYVLFVGFRLETGMDWPVYKNVFAGLAEEPIWGDYLERTLQYGQEPGYLFLNSVASHVFADYEVLQAINSAVFVLSVFALSREFGARNIPMAFAVANSYLWMNVEFSTVRQSLAIAFFNLAVVALLRRRRGFVVFWGACAVSVQMSAAIYLAAMLYAVASQRSLKRALGVLIVAPIVLAGVLYSGALTAVLPEIARTKLDYYAGRVYAGFSEPLTYFFPLLAVFAAVMVFRKVSIPEESAGRVQILRKMILALAFAVFPALLVPVFRDRIAYELVLLLGVYLSLSIAPWFWQARLALFGWGLGVTTYLTVFANLTPFTPYQNYLVYSVMGWQSTGPQRSDIFLGLGEGG